MQGVTSPAKPWTRIVLKGTDRGNLAKLPPVKKTENATDLSAVLFYLIGAKISAAIFGR